MVRALSPRTTLGEYLDAQGYGEPFQRRSPAADGGRNLVRTGATVARLSGAALHTVLREPRTAETDRPPGLAHGRSAAAGCMCRS